MLVWIPQFSHKQRKVSPSMQSPDIVRLDQSVYTIAVGKLGNNVFLPI